MWRIPRTTRVSERYPIDGRGCKLVEQLGRPGASVSSSETKTPGLRSAPGPRPLSHCRSERASERYPIDGRGAKLVDQLGQDRAGDQAGDSPRAGAYNGVFRIRQAVCAALRHRAAVPQSSQRRKSIGTRSHRLLTV